MVATVVIYEKNGAGETPTNKTSLEIRYKSADDALVNNDDPMVIPAAGSNFSFDKWIRLSITIVPDNQIENLLAYTDGANGFGTGVFAWFKTVAAFVTPTAPGSAGGYSDLFSATIGSPIDMDALNTGPFTTAVDIGDYLQTMLQVDSTAGQGTLPNETLTFSYDES